MIHTLTVILGRSLGSTVAGHAHLADHAQKVEFKIGT